ADDVVFRGLGDGAHGRAVEVDLDLVGIAVGDGDAFEVLDDLDPEALSAFRRPDETADVERAAQRELNPIARRGGDGNDLPTTAARRRAGCFLPTRGDRGVGKIGRRDIGRHAYGRGALARNESARLLRGASARKERAAGGRGRN